MPTILTNIAQAMLYNSQFKYNGRKSLNKTPNNNERLLTLFQIVMNQN
jgi:hypothetical protein